MPNTRDNAQVAAAKWNFSQAVLVAVITAAASIVVTLLTLRPQPNRQEKAIDTAPIVAKGLAVGYLYNFVTRLDPGRNGLIIHFPTNETRVNTDPNSGERRAQFDKEHIRLEILFPNHLSKDCLDRSKDQVDQFPQAMVVVSTKERAPRINYGLELSEGTNLTLVIKDNVQTLNALIHYAEKRLVLQPNSPDWLMMEKEALSQFRDEFEDLRHRIDGGEISRVTWTPVD